MVRRRVFVWHFEWTVAITGRSTKFKKTRIFAHLLLKITFDDTYSKNNNLRTKNHTKNDWKLDKLISISMFWLLKTFLFNLTSCEIFCTYLKCSCVVQLSSNISVITMFGTNASNYSAHPTRELNHRGTVRCQVDFLDWTGPCSVTIINFPRGYYHSLVDSMERNTFPSSELQLSSQLGIWSFTGVIGSNRSWGLERPRYENTKSSDERLKKRPNFRKTKSGSTNLIIVGSITVPSTSCQTGF